MVVVEKGLTAMCFERGGERYWDRLMAMAFGHWDTCDTHFEA